MRVYSRAEVVPFRRCLVSSPLCFSPYLPISAAPRYELGVMVFIDTFTNRRQSVAEASRVAGEETWRLPTFSPHETDGPVSEDANFPRSRQNVSGAEATLVWEKAITMTIHHGECAAQIHPFQF